MKLLLSSLSLLVVAKASTIPSSTVTTALFGGIFDSVPASPVKNPLSKETKVVSLTRNNLKNQEVSGISTNATNPLAPKTITGCALPSSTINTGLTTNSVVANTPVITSPAPITANAAVFKLYKEVNMLALLRLQIQTAETTIYHIKKQLGQKPEPLWFDVIKEGFNNLKGEMVKISLVQPEGPIFNSLIQAAFTEVETFFTKVEKEKAASDLLVRVLRHSTQADLQGEITLAKDLYTKKATLKADLAKNMEAFNAVPANSASKMTLPDTSSKQLMKKLAELRTTVTEKLAAQYSETAVKKPWSAEVVALAGNISSIINEISTYAKKMVLP